jgi:hypothetical protein
MINPNGILTPVFLFISLISRLYDVVVRLAIHLSFDSSQKKCGHAKISILSLPFSYLDSSEFLYGTTVIRPDRESTTFGHLSISSVRPVSFCFHFHLKEKQKDIFFFIVTPKRSIAMA